MSCEGVCIRSTLIVLLAVGTAFYVPLGSRRGYLQGAYGFRRLATNLVLEGGVRLGGSLVLILCGLGVRGVIAANSAAVAAAYLAIVPEAATRIPNPIGLPLTILDGNHRLVAAMLASPSRVPSLRFLCGLSPG